MADINPTSTPPTRNSGVTVEQILLSQTSLCGFRQLGAEGSSWKLTLFFGQTGTGVPAEKVGNSSGGPRTGSGTRKAGRPQAGGRATETGSVENTGLSLPTEHQSWNPAGGRRTSSTLLVQGRGHSTEGPEKE